MNPWKISAQYAAYLWFLEQHPGKADADAVLFAKSHWSEFLPCAHEGIGKLLIALGKA